MNCPQCVPAGEAGLARCPACAAPLLLLDDPAASPLDHVLDLDRRGPVELGDVMLPGSAPALAISEHELGFENGDGEPAAPSGGEVEVIEAPPPRGPRRPRPASSVVPEPSDVQLACAPLERRLMAWAIDSAVLLVTLAPALACAALALPSGSDRLGALGLPAVALGALLAFAYGALTQGVMGATLGQRLCGLRVVGPDGRRPGIARSAGRAACAAVGAAVFGLGLLPALLGRTGRGVHDFLAGTVVVRATP